MNCWSSGKQFLVQSNWVLCLQPHLRPITGSTSRLEKALARRPFIEQVSEILNHWRLRHDFKGSWTPFDEIPVFKSLDSTNVNVWHPIQPHHGPSLSTPSHHRPHHTRRRPVESYFLKLLITIFTTHNLAHLPCATWTPHWQVGLLRCRSHRIPLVIRTTPTNRALCVSCPDRHHLFQTTNSRVSQRSLRLFSIKHVTISRIVSMISHLSLSMTARISEACFSLVDDDEGTPISSSLPRLSSLVYPPSASKLIASKISLEGSSHAHTTYTLQVIASHAPPHGFTQIQPADRSVFRNPSQSRTWPWRLL